MRPGRDQIRTCVSGKSISPRLNSFDYLLTPDQILKKYCVKIIYFMVVTEISLFLTLTFTLYSLWQ